MLGELLAEERADAEADDAIEEPSRLLGGHAVHIDVAGMGERVLDRGLRDLVEGDALRLLVRNLQRLLQVPGDRLPFAVGVGSEVDHAGRLGPLLEVLDEVGPIGENAVGRRPVVLDVDAEPALREIADMPLARNHFEIVAEIFVDRLRLGRRLDDDEALFLLLRHGPLLLARCLTVGSVPADPKYGPNWPLDSAGGEASPANRTEAATPRPPSIVAGRVKGIIIIDATGKPKRAAENSFGGRSGAPWPALGRSVVLEILPGPLVLLGLPSGVSKVPRLRRFPVVGSDLAHEIGGDTCPDEILRIAVPSGHPRDRASSTAPERNCNRSAESGI